MDPCLKGLGECICKICTCGRHHCPHKPANNGPYTECLVTEYNNQYITHNLERPELRKPVCVPTQSTNPLSNITTHKTDYVNHNLEPRFVHETATYEPPVEKMESTTMYKQEFTEQPIVKNRYVAKNELRQQSTKFEGQPTYQSDYQAWELPKQYIPKSVEWTASTEPFNGYPTYKHDYVKYPHQQTELIRPQQVQKVEQAPLSDVTDYRQSYVPHPINVERHVHKAEWKSPSVSFGGISTFKQDYTMKHGEKMSSCKPPNAAYAPIAPLSSETTMRSEYKPWELERQPHPETNIYKKPEGSMNGRTTYFNDFKQHPLVRQAAIRHADRKREMAAFQGVSNYKESYKPWAIAQMSREGRNNEYVSPSVPFDGLTTFKSDYIPHSVEKHENVKPQRVFRTNEAPFEDGTIYKNDYTEKPLERCPAATLDTENSPYEYSGKDNTGHMFYNYSARDVPMEA